jgi:N-acetylmuramate 1-kinase
MNLTLSPLPSARPAATERAAVVADFLARSGWAAAARAPLAGDASPRRYERLRIGERRAVLMDAEPGPDADPAPFVAVTQWLRENGFSAPEILAADAGAGLVLLEDLGDDLYARVLARSPEMEPRLYAAAADVLAALHALPPPAGGGGWRPGAYDLDAFLRESRLVVEWYLPAAAGGAAAAGCAEALEATLRGLAPLAATARPVAVLRDFHAENLLWLPERRGHARVGLLDYQDLLIGHPAYDLVSLLEDARRGADEAAREATQARYVAAAGVDAEEFAAASAFLAAQRNLKILGIFVRLHRRDGKPGYLRHLPRVWTHLQRDLSHPALAPLRDWAACLPAPDGAALARIEAGA